MILQATTPTRLPGIIFGREGIQAAHRQRRSIVPLLRFKPLQEITLSGTTGGVLDIGILLARNEHLEINSTLKFPVKTTWNSQIDLLP